jgi:antitoxin MazE
MPVIAKWGNSLAIRIPAVVAEAMDWKAGDEIEIRAAGDQSVEAERKPTSRELIERLRKYRGRMPADWKFDRLEANDQE